MAEPENEIQEYSLEPDIDALKNDFERCRNNLSYYLDLSQEAKDLRKDLWAGKSKTSRKESEDSWPWQGSSDLDPCLIGPICDSDVATLTTAVSKANITAAPTEASDISSAAIVTNFMKWRLSSMDEFPRELNIGANYLQENGICFFGVSFKREVTRVLRPLSLEEIAAISPELVTAIADDEMKDSSLELLQGAFPEISKSRIRKMYKELRRDGVTEVPQTEVVTSRPTVRAYELGRDLIVDSNLQDLQSARAIYTTQYLTPEQLMGKVKTDNYDKDFVEEIIENTTGDYENAYDGFSEALLTGQNESPDHFDGLVRLVTAFRKEVDEDGIPICCVTIFSEHGEGYAKKYIMNVDQGSYPFVCITREQLTRRLFDSRGIPELLRSHSIAVKSEADQRRDAASLMTCPPLEYTIGRRPEKIGAGTQIPVRRRGEVGWMEVPRFNPASTQVEMDIRNLAAKMTGRATSEADAVEANVLRQSYINNWLHGISQVMRKMWVLDRTYNSQIFFRVSNNAQGQQIVMDETAHKYDFILTFNSINSDESKVIEKLQAVGQIMSQYDRSGQANYSAFMRTFLDAIDPNLAAQLLMPADEATTRTILETSQDIARISSGQVVDAPTKGANPQLRLQVLQQYIQGTEQIPAEDVQQRLQQDEKFRDRLENYQKQLTFQIQQMENARIGALGAAPGNVPGTAF